MENKLKHYYESLVDKDNKGFNIWYNNYKNFFNHVHYTINKDESWKQDKDFLDKLIKTRDNGIASCKQSGLLPKRFNSFIKDDNFMSALESLIKNPTENTYHELYKNWKGKQNHLLINRIAAASTLGVSTTVSVKKFDAVFKWLMKEKMISEYPYNTGRNNRSREWFARNQFLMKEIREKLQNELENEKTDEFYLSMFVWRLNEHIENPEKNIVAPYNDTTTQNENMKDIFAIKNQVIKYGPPGTGKTYEAKKQAESHFNEWKKKFAPTSYYMYAEQHEFVQFHPSFSYEDFMEGLRPVPDKNEATQLRLQNGVFKDFCIKASKWELDIYNHKICENQNFSSLTIKDIENSKSRLTEKENHWKYIFDIGDSSILLIDAIPPFYFIIDEINRAELSRVLGELMYCLEYRGVKGVIKTQYSTLNDKETGMFNNELGYQFFIPFNIRLIGTMNTIDRSIESFDFALRRRFHWEEVVPNIDILKQDLAKKKQDWVGLAENLEFLNKEITNTELLGSDYQIGHAYLMNMKYPNNLTLDEVRNKIWVDCIYPLLHEYLRGTGGKENELIQQFRKVFGMESNK